MLKSRIKDEKSIIKIEKDKMMQKLNCCQKLYLWIRHNYVVDIIFRKSEEELDDIVMQMKKGRTSVKTTIEIGIQNTSKRERQ